MVYVSLANYWPTLWHPPSATPIALNTFPQHSTLLHDHRVHGGYFVSWIWLDLTQLREDGSNKYRLGPVVWSQEKGYLESCITILYLLKYFQTDNASCLGLLYLPTYHHNQCTSSTRPHLTTYENNARNNKKFRFWSFICKTLVWKGIHTFIRPNFRT